VLIIRCQRRLDSSVGREIPALI